MRYVKFSGNAGYCGTSFEDYAAFEDKDMVDGYLDEYLNDLVQDNAESYAYLATANECEDDYDSLEDYEEAIEQTLEDYYSNCGGHWEEVSKEEYETYK